MGILAGASSYTRKNLHALISLLYNIIVVEKLESELRQQKWPAY